LYFEFLNKNRPVNLIFVAFGKPEMSGFFDTGSGFESLALSMCGVYLIFDENTLIKVEI
jgi:hypothetical protein